jgi:hypothetical protein
MIITAGHLGAAVRRLQDFLKVSGTPWDEKYTEVDREAVGRLLKATGMSNLAIEVLMDNGKGDLLTGVAVGVIACQLAMQDQAEVPG